MQSISVPEITLRTSRLGFGTASLHHLLWSSDRQNLLERAFDVGFTHFDTAPMYGDGLAERELGKFLKQKREKVTISTKIGLPSIPLFEKFPPLLYAHRALRKIGKPVITNWDHRPRDLSIGSVESSLQASLTRLRTNSIDILFIHEPLAIEINQIYELASWLEQKKNLGQVRYLGLAGKAVDCLAIAEQTGNLFDVLQVEDSLANREADLIIRARRPLQITFGYLRQASQISSTLTGEEVIRQALERNTQGIVLVSSRRHQRLSSIANLAS